MTKTNKRQYIYYQWALLILFMCSTTAYCENPKDAKATMKKSTLKYEETIKKLEAAIQQELKTNLTGVSIALVDDQKLIYAGGFGYADEKKKTPATTKTLYRAGSVSKLFTALSAMQLAEQGKLDIDKPITEYIPTLTITNPFDGSKPVTMRMLMCHRAGMIRESPVGSYFDSTEPSLQKTVDSINQCAIVFRPGTKYRYSNVGPTLVGYIAAKKYGCEFEDVQRKNILGPLGMKSSSFILKNVDKKQVAKGYMRVAKTNGTFKRIEAPLFELGTLPAGNLYSNVEDMSHFISWLLNDGKFGKKQLIKKKTLQEMWTPQLTKKKTGAGLGFIVDNFRKSKRVQHGGAVYGFSTYFAILPEEKIGVIVMANDDLSGGRTRYLSEVAMSLMLKEKKGMPLPKKKKVIELSEKQLAKYTGEFESASYWATIKQRGNKLLATISGQPFELTPVGENKFILSGRMANENSTNFTMTKGGKIKQFSVMGQTFKPVDPKKVKPIPKEWKKFLGSYGPDFIPLIVHEKNGNLYAMTENMYDYRLRPENRTVFRMPIGMYTFEELVFHLSPEGKVYAATLANMTLPRVKK